MKKQLNDRPNILAVIPARGGSKSVPRKNIKPIAGRPLIDYMIQAALGSKELTHVCLSSEDAEILSIGKKWGGPNLLLVDRPKELAEDTTPSLPVVQHAVTELEKRLGLTFDYVVLLQPIMPLAFSSDIDACIRMLIDTKSDSVVSMCIVNDYHPMKIKRLKPDGTLTQFVPDMPETIFRRQDLEPAYWRNGAIYAVTREAVMENKFTLGFFCGPVTRPYVMPRERSVDINHPMDFVAAEALIEKGILEGKDVLASEKKPEEKK